MGLRSAGKTRTRSGTARRNRKPRIPDRKPCRVAARQPVKEGQNPRPSGRGARQFLTGRSPASRDRAMRLIGGDLVVGPLAPGEHDPLRHYAAATATDEWLVLGNGEQASQVAERLRGGASATDALSGLQYEPDPPIRTSRITALISRDGGRATVFGAARPSRAARLTSNVMTLAVQDLEPGEAVLLTTYTSDGELVSVAAPFTETTVKADDAEELLNEIWSALDERFRIAATVIDPVQGPSSAIQRSS
ncbi:IMP cyclohydrolase [Streptomyces sp. NPDC021080]|uniref:IMP cyclohydrolase n=1 Tax=Streptomyces sp. NPDC021080 TaxID=3365110 RepID=UPI003794989B